MKILNILMNQIINFIQEMAPPITDPIKGDYQKRKNFINSLIEQNTFQIKSTIDALSFLNKFQPCFHSDISDASVVIGTGWTEYSACNNCKRIIKNTEIENEKLLAKKYQESMIILSKLK